jgi:metallo-beta-lactamase family protein
LLLPDSAHLQEEEARFAAQRGFSRHRQPQPLYTREDAEAAIGRLQEIDFDIEQKLGGGISAKLIPAGHLLGAAQVRLSVSARTIHFSGDVGRPNDSIVRPPRAFSGADILVCESTYGDRVHPPVDAEAELAQVIGRVARRGGVVIVPAFAVGRAQAIMLQIARLKARGAIPDVPVFLNSPMAIDATAIYHEYHGEHHISDEDCRSMYAGAQRIRTVEESKELNRRSGPFVVISASGMLTGGRVLHHIVSFGSDARNAIVLSGFQAGGTRGAALAAGERSLRIFGQEVAINAEVVQIEGLSGHADANELMAWLRNGSAPEMTYVTHGEPASADALRFRIDHELGWRVRVPEHLERIDLGHPQ